MRPLAAAAAALFLFPLTASAADPAQTAAICGQRSTCAIARSHDAGKAASGASLTVEEVHLGLRDKPDDTGEGCRNGDEFDGGVEYWLIESATPPRRILKLCNDGYGAAGVGDDSVEIAANRLVHTQSGGSAWRWDSVVTYSLAPWQAVSERSCNFHTSIETTGTTTDLDFTTRSVRSLAKDSRKKDVELGCPDWPPETSATLTPEPAPGLYAAYNLVVPGTTGDALALPSGTAIGDCVPAMTTAGANGFLVYGKPSAPGQVAEVKTVATSLQELVIQVLDPTAPTQPAPAGGSWIDLPHVEIWIGLNGEEVRTRLGVDDLHQTGVDLAGKVHEGVGRKGPLPSVEHWPAKDEAGRPVVVLRLRWADDYALLHGVALVYSQADAGKQARLVATTGIANNRPLYVPSVVPLSDRNIEPRPGTCHLGDGLLSADR